jgi:ketosteroid isomerase-like protein
LEPKDEIGLLNRFNAEVNRHNVDAMMALMTADCVFDNTLPAPDGTLVQGQEDMRRFWQDFFDSSRHAHFEVEEISVHGDRAFQRWIYTWTDLQGVDGHVRGVDIFRFRDGLIAEKLSYVKG